VAYLPDGETLSVGGRTMERGSVRAVLPIDESAYVVALSEDGRTLYVDGALVDVATGERRRKTLVGTCAAFAGNRLVVGIGERLMGANRLAFIDVETGKRVRTIPVEGKVNEIGATADTVITAAHDGRVRFIEKKEVVVRRWHSSDSVSRLDLSRNRRFCATASDWSTRRAVFSDVTKRAKLLDHVIAGRIGCVAISDDGALGFVGDDSRVIVRIPGGDVVSRLALTAPPIAAAFSPDGSEILVGDTGGAVYRFRTRDGARLGGPAPMHDGAIVAVRELPGGRLVTAGSDGLVRIDGEALAGPRHAREINRMAVRADGKLALTTGEDGKIVPWDLVKRRSRAPQEIGVFSYGITFVRGDRVLVAKESEMLLWDVGKRRLVEELEGDVLMHEDCLIVDGIGVSGCDDEAVMLWDLGKRRCAGRIDTGEDVSYLAAAGGARVLAAGGGKVACLVDVKRKRVLARLRGHDDWIIAVASDGKRGATASLDGTVRSWQLGTRIRSKVVLDLRAVGDVPSALAYAKNGDLLVGTRCGIIERV
jgi:WD40 repeat protein